MAVDSITEDTVHEHAREYSNRDEVVADPNTWAWVARQRRLLHALLSQPDLLRRYVEARAEGAAVEEVGTWVFHGLDRDGADRGSDPFWEAVGLLDEADRAYFEERDDALLLYESTVVLAAPSLRVDEAFRVVPGRVDLDVIGED